MRHSPHPWFLLPLVLGTVLLTASPASAQAARSLSLALSAGPGAVQVRGREGSWTFGPFVGGRLEWGNRRSAALLTLDVQPFRGEDNPTTGHFRAMYVLPSYAVGSGGRRLGFGLGLGAFDFQGGAMEDGVEVGFVTALSGSMRITGTYFVELGWRRIQNVRGLRPDVWSLQLVKRWRL